LNLGGVGRKVRVQQFVSGRVVDFVLTFISGRHQRSKQQQQQQQQQQIVLTSLFGIRL
jgi:hypothetical protein